MLRVLVTRARMLSAISASFRLFQFETRSIDSTMTNAVPNSVKIAPMRFWVVANVS